MDGPQQLSCQAEQAFSHLQSQASGRLSRCRIAASLPLSRSVRALSAPGAPSRTTPTSHGGWLLRLAVWQERLLRARDFLLWQERLLVRRFSCSLS